MLRALLYIGTAPGSFEYHFKHGLEVRAWP